MTKEGWLPIIERVNREGWLPITERANGERLKAAGKLKPSRISFSMSNESNVSP